MEKACTACKKKVANDKTSVSFLCPKCGLEVIRCGMCRKTAVPYKCKCGFEGP